MCNNLVVLHMIFILKIIIVLILPIVLLIIRKKKYSKIIFNIELVLLILLLIFNIFKINSCIYNSTLSGFERVNNKNKINFYNNLHPTTLDYTSKDKIANKYDKTYKGRDLYYFNVNDKYFKNKYYECNNTKVYYNTFGSSITSFSIAISTLYDKEVNPIEILNYYKSDTPDVCNNKITIENIYNSVMRRYGSITLNIINKYEIESAIKNGGIVIAKIEANENSKLTCDSNYIVIYNIGLDGKYMLADPALPKKSYVCPYSSDAYGNVISSKNMNKSWTLDEIDNESVIYYLVKKG